MVNSFSELNQGYYTRDYDSDVRAYSSKFQKVLLTDEDLVRLKSFAKYLAENKRYEHFSNGSYHKDVYNEDSRWLSGLIGERAVEILLGVKIIDWSVSRNSAPYNVPDIRGCNVGIKTCKRGNYPIIFKRNEYPQIICIRDDRFENLVWACGIASVEALNKYQDDEMVRGSLRERGTKTCFYGFKDLLSLKGIKNNIEMIKI